MSDQKNIDKLFQERFKDFEATPDPMMWDKISSQLDKKEAQKKRKGTLIPLFYKAAGIAAALLLLFFVGSKFFDTNTEGIIDTEQSSTDTESTNKKDANSESITTTTDTENKKNDTNNSSETPIKENQEIATENNSDTNSDKHNNKSLATTNTNGSNLKDNTNPNKNNVTNTKEAVAINNTNGSNSKDNTNPNKNNATNTKEAVAINNTNGSNSKDNTNPNKNNATNTKEAVAINNTNGSNLKDNTNPNKNNATNTKEAVAINNTNGSNSKDNTNPNKNNATNTKEAVAINNTNGSNLKDNTNSNKNNATNTKETVAINNTNGSNSKDTSAINGNSSNGVSTKEAMASATANIDSLATTKEAVAETTEIKRSVLDVINELHELEKDTEVAEEETPRWSIAPNASPVYYNTMSSGSPIDEAFADNTKKGDVNLSYGINVGYNVSKRFTVRSGIHKVDYSYSTNDITITPSIAGNNINTIAFRRSASNLAIVDRQTAASNSGFNSDDIATLESSIRQTKFNGNLNQRMSYIEVPVEVKYAVLDKKIGINLIGGVSTLLLTENKIILDSPDLFTVLGEANNLNSLSFSTNIGLGIDYQISKQIEFNLEPMLKYQLNTFSGSTGNFKPYSVGIYTGVSFRF